MNIQEIIEHAGALPLSGNIIPSNWYYHILSNGKKQRADLVAINILAEILYWYRPGKNGNKKFKGDALRIQIPNFMEKFNLGEDQVKDALSKLRKLELISTQRRVIKNETTGNFETLYFITPIIKNIEAITTNDTSSGNFPSKEIVQGEKSPPINSTTQKAQAEISPNQEEKSPPRLREEISPPYKEKENDIKNNIYFSLLGIWERQFKFKTGKEFTVSPEDEAVLSSFIENGITELGFHQQVKEYFGKRRSSYTLPNMINSP